MGRLGTALEQRRETGPPGRTRAALGRHLLAGLLDRHATSGTVGQPRVRGAADAVLRPLGDRLGRALEHGLARAVERRLNTGARTRAPSALENRLARALARRLPAGWSPVGRAHNARTGAVVAVGGRRRRRLPSGRLRSRASLREVAVHILARGVVRALAVFVRILGRALLSSPLRRLGRMLIRRTGRARTSSQAGLLALALGAAALLAQTLARRLAGISTTKRMAFILALRLLRALLPRLFVLAALLLRALRRLVGRGLRRARGAAKPWA